ncbi:unnamed protein product [Acanthoscelides obtectus]|uniref:Phosphoenolpyruvate synthase n=1 Tax=Acanthoscelides obtectus TaxID=200917 RepID=A0A9P0JKW7_ACAOB|nr:unnamed protein product [Acanthoscelides obtectus]CAK1654991.1 Probable phosphoenolpyruvate synthase [Acanthoscelides obtectus]
MVILLLSIISREHQIGFDQFGALKGLVKIGNDSTEYYLNLPCCRKKDFGIGDRFIVNRALKILIVDEYGNLIHLILKSFEEGCSQVNHGTVYTSDYKLLTLKGIDIRLVDIAPDKVFPEMMTVHVQTEKRVFKCIIHLNKKRMTTGAIDRKYGYEIFNVPAECDVNCFQGKGIVEFWYKKKGSTFYIPLPRLHEKEVSPLPNDLIVDMQSDHAKVLSMTGGKGNSLALLTSLNSQMFSVPEGFIVTVNSYKKQLAKYPELRKAISSIDDICCGKSEGVLENVCKRSVELFKSSKLAEEIEEAIKNQLKIYDSDMKSGWAVRSSAIREDSEELSAAGQNETFLGCQTVEQILDSVLACWGSLFTYQSVKYRWQHGLPIQSDMAIVVQKMVPADCAGVLFTCHPTTCNPQEMVVTSNFGLGETVVSGESDPDTFVIRRTWDGKLSISSSSLGLKNIVMKMATDGVKEISDRRAGQFSLSEEQVLLLGEVGIRLEEAFGNPRDIEWAFREGNLYLLQSRPITTLSLWSDYEFDHETDSPILTNTSVLTIANVKEVIPNSMTILTETSVIREVDASIQKFAIDNYDPCSSKGLRPFMHHAMLDVVASIHKNVAKEVHVSSLILDLAIFGHPVLDNKLNHILIKRNGITPIISKVKDFLRVINAVLKNKQILKESVEAAKRISLEELKGPMPIIYNKIKEALKDLEIVALCHSRTSTVSVFYQVVAINVLLERQSELSTDHYADFAAILSSCEDVVSAEIPSYLESISKIVRDHGLAEEFCKLKAYEAIEWLEQNCPEANKVLLEFLNKHGHRNLGEFEVIEKSWAEDPTQLIPMLQANARNEKKVQNSKHTVDEIVAKLKSPKSNITRHIVKYLMKKIRVAVGVREQSKSEFIRATNKIRLGFRALGKQMVQHGMLPSAELIYHLTLYELGELINERNPVLVTRAVRRQRLYSKWKHLRFPELMYGIPVPENLEDRHAMIISDAGVCRGTPVCTGVVKARACVINTLEEIDKLQTGDILITYSTDIGWSPYFPMLSGLVTELGGLVSHGAVVAREYGLPCIVGAKDATTYFRTGDTVILNGDIGQIGKG